MLDEPTQRDVAAWTVKTLMVNDLPGNESLLRPRAPEMHADGVAPDYLEVWAGPPTFPKFGTFAMTGVWPIEGTQVIGGQRPETLPSGRGV